MIASRGRSVVQHLSQAQPVACAVIGLQRKAYPVIVLCRRFAHLDAQKSHDSASLPPFPELFYADVDKEICLQNKPTSALVRAALVLKLCSYPVFVRNAEKALLLSQKILGMRLTSALMRFTFYGQFCVGEDRQDIQRSESLLRNENLKPIFCITAEEGSKPPEIHLRDDWFERNKQSMFKCLEISREIATDSKPLHPSQFKLTAVLDASISRTLSDAIRSGAVDVDKIVDALHKPETEVEYDFLSDEEKSHFFRGLRRAREICCRARDLNVAVLIDAEHSDINPSLNFIAIALMCQFNKILPVVQYTYQCYLKDSYSELSRDVAFCRDRGLRFGAKIVRGAYLEWERDFARARNVQCAVYGSWEETNANYDKVVAKLINELSVSDDVHFLIATHNEHSLKSASSRIQQLGIDPADSRVGFAQLYGLSDHLSNWLAQTNFAVFKSSPIGSMQETLPYLVRRAQENSSIIQDSRKDRKMIWSELMNRVRGSSR